MEHVEPVIHDWIENQADFEGVLVCTNELKDWDESAVVRAFQTFEWNDASTPGNDACFAHIATGVIIRYEGGVLAIEFGHGELSAALSDLFMVLHQIGWRSADLYHAQETMNLLLVDMGRAIPASMDFDVRPAKAGRSASEFTEGVAEALVARGRQILVGGTDEVNRVLMDEMASLDVSVLDSQVLPSIPPPRPIVLIDDDENGYGGDMVVVQGFKAAQVSPADSAAQGVNVEAPPVVDDFDFDEQPQTFTLPVLPANSGESQIITASLHGEEDAVQGKVIADKLDHIDLNSGNDVGSTLLATVNIDSKDVQIPVELIKEQFAWPIDSQEVERERARPQSALRSKLTVVVKLFRTHQ